MADRTAIILGASGSVGQALLAEVTASKGFARIVVMARRALTQPVAANVETRLLPEMSPAVLERAVVDVLADGPGDDRRNDRGEAVGFSVLGVGAGTARLSLAEHRAIDVELNAAFARGLKATGKVSHLVFMSAIGANAQASTTGSGAAGMPRYARVKGESEVAVMKQGPAVVSIFRPSVILGSQHTPALISAAFRLLGPVTPAKYRPVRTTEIAQAMVAAALRPPAASAVYTYPEMMTLIEKSRPSTPASH